MYMYKPLHTVDTPGMLPHCSMSGGEYIDTQAYVYNYMYTY